ncbi:MAG: peptidoglycan DD-metalloendopeptidase family protein [Alphaproteobacteria bacterium]|nr:peptidoglycan DD-metalloendopeptidase family protein [Alphaproteobacteria bacterium]
MWREITPQVFLCTLFCGVLSYGYAEEAPLPPIYINQEITLKSGEALTQTLTRAGFSNADAHAVTHPLKKKVALNRLRPGNTITVGYWLDNNQTLNSLSFNAPHDKIAEVSLKDGTYEATVKDRPLTRVRSVSVGNIRGSLYHSAKKANLPASLVPDFANLFAYELDFTRDIRAGDSFRVVFDEIRDESGEYVRSGNILAAELYARGKKRSAYRFKDNRGVIEYYDENGSPKKKLLLRTPLEFTRISSHFNPSRKHPVLGYTKAHRGTDFAAPTGTPVKAAGNGVIERANWYGAYGKYVRVRHTGKYKTAYAHLHRIARGIKPGKRVRQGQVIGYVGTTGRSTGPHLHYEVHVNGKRVNAMRAKIPAGNPLPRKLRGQFHQLVTNMKSLWEVQVAKNNENQG